MNKPRVYFSQVRSASGASVYCQLLQQALAERFEMVALDNRGIEERNKTTPPEESLRWVTARLIAGYLRDGWRMTRFFARRRRQADILHVNRMGCEVDAIAARCAGIRAIVGTLHVLPGEGPQARHWFRRAVEWLSLRAAARLIAISDAVADAWSRRVGLPRERFTVIYNGVDLERCARGRAHPAHLERADKIVVVITGRLHHLKGHDDLLRALALVEAPLRPRLHLLIVGDGPARADLERQAEALGLKAQVTFTGQVDNVYPLLARAQIFVLPSRYEGLSLSVVEALAMGLPCVVADSGGMAEIVRKSGGGEVVPVGDCAALAEALQRYAADPERCRTAGERGRRFAEAHLDVRQMAAATAEVYASLAAGPERTGAPGRPSAARVPTTDAVPAHPPHQIRDAPFTGRAERFQCVACGHGTLQIRTGALACPACGRAYPLAYGCPDFGAARDFYWGELPRAQMQAILNLDRQVDETLRNLLAAEDAALAGYLKQYVFDPRRAAWKYLTALRPGGVALDFGCGWGALALGLAENVSELIVADAIAERVAITVRRLREHGFPNVTGCVASGWPRLPFPAGSLDLVVLNGVLEWLPESLPGRPADIQAAFLREVARVLKPDGQLYIGIENRYGAGYFLGQREEHTGLRFIALLPRWLGGLYHRLARKQPFRAYTHGRRGLEKMLRRAGFGAARFYWPYPDYREFSRVVEIDNPRWYARSFAPRSRTGRIAYALYRHVGLVRRTVRSFGVIATPAVRLTTWLDRLRGHLCARDRLAADSRPTNYQITSTGTVHVVLGDANPYLLSLPLDQRTRARHLREIEARSIMSALLIRPAVADALRRFESGEFEGQLYKLEPLSRGRRAGHRPPEQRAAFYGQCIRWLNEFHAQERRREPFALSDTILSQVEFARKFVISLLDPAVRATRRAVLQAIEAQPTVVCPVHGDFHRDNILLDEAGRIVRVVDWDLSLPQGSPVWDVMTLLTYDLFEDGLTWSDAYRHAALALLGEEEEGILTPLAAEMQLESRDVWYGVLTFPAVQLRNKIVYGDRKVKVILAGLGEILSGFIERAAREMGIEGNGGSVESREQRSEIRDQR